MHIDVTKGTRLPAKPYSTEKLLWKIKVNTVLIISENTAVARWIYLSFRSESLIHCNEYIMGRDSAYVIKIVIRMLPVKRK